MQWQFGRIGSALIALGALLIPAYAAAVGTRMVGGVGAAGNSSAPFNDTWRIGVHNAYWWDTGAYEAFASGPSQHLLDDLTIDRARGLEFDLHYDPRGAHDSYGVYHTNDPSHSLCARFVDCLKVLRAYHYDNPAHDPIVVNLEIKNILPSTPFWTDQATPADFDATLSRYLGPDFGLPPGAPPSGPDWIFGPSDYFSWCAHKLQSEGVIDGIDVDNLRGAVAACGWPSLADLRGKFIVTFHGAFYGDPVHVYDYSHGPHGIAQARVFPMAEVMPNDSLSDCASGDQPYAGGGQCNWDDHSVFAEASADVVTRPDKYPFFADPAGALRQFVAQSGILRYMGEQETLPDVARTLASPVPGFPTPNQVQTDAPVSVPVNFQPSELADANPRAPLDWSSGCTPDPACTAPLVGTDPGVDLRVLGASTPGLGASRDRIAFASLARARRIASLRAFVSTRTNARHDTAGATVTANWSCLMARASQAPDAAYFAVCRHRHGDLTPEPVRVLYRLVQGGRTYSVYLGQNGVTPPNLPNLGNAEIVNDLQLNHDAAGRCWTAYARATLDPYAAQFGPEWSPALVGSVCFAAPLNDVGFGTDGGFDAAERAVGESYFADATYDGRSLTAADFRGLTCVGATAGATMTDRGTDAVTGTCGAGV